MINEEVTRFDINIYQRHCVTDLEHMHTSRVPSFIIISITHFSLLHRTAMLRGRSSCKVSCTLFVVRVSVFSLWGD